jgi:pilus assembly protein CpaB
VTVEEAKTTIVVADQALAFGAVLGTNNVKEVPWPASSKPEGAFSSVQDLLKDGRRLVLHPFVRDEPIVASKVSGPNERASLSTVIEEGKRAVTVAVDDVRGVAGFIFPGDYVDVVLTRTGANTGPANFSEVILQHVKVLAIDQVSGERGERQERPTVAKAVTVEVTQEQALKILLAANIGHLSLILRQSAEMAMAPEARVTDRDLYGGDGAQGFPPSQAVAAPAAATPEPATRKVTVVRSMTSEDYQVPRDAR